MKKFLMIGLMGMVAELLATPSVEVTSITENANNRELTITYTLSGAPAIVTVDILRNDVLLDELNYGNVLGDIHKKITEDGTYSFKWRPDAKNGSEFETAQLSFKVDAWDLKSPPNYMVVGLAETNRIAYYASTNAFPGGLLRNPYYRTDAMVMRYIKAKDVTTWLGAWDSDKNQSLENGAGNDETRYQATFTNDFWIGVFEVTQAQSELVRGTTNGGSWNSVDSNLLYRAMRPATLVSYNDLRDKNNSANYYPNPPHSSSWLGNIRRMAPFPFDLPNDSQWEYACRAGADVGYWNDGTSMQPAGGKVSYNNYSYRSDIVIPGRWMANGGVKSLTSGKSYYGYDRTFWTNDEMMMLSADECRSATCGSYAPNAWGLYDMHGNAMEYVNDYYTTNNSIWKTLAGKPNINPSNPAQQYDGSKPLTPSWKTDSGGYYRLMRSGEYARGAMECRSASRCSQHVSGCYACNGFRLIINL